MSERIRPSGLTQVDSSVNGRPNEDLLKSRLPESPLSKLPGKVISTIGVLGLALAACTPVNAATPAEVPPPTISAPAATKIENTSTVPPATEGAPIPAATETPVPDFSKPSIFKDLFLGQYKNPDGSLQSAGTIPGYSSEVNTFYREGSPLAAAFGIDNNWLTTEYFHASTDKSGITRGMTPDGKQVIQQGNAWVIEQTGEEFVPFVPSIAGKPFGYPVITSDGKLALVDNQGQTIPGGEPKKLFQKPADLAKYYGFTGDSSKIVGVDVNKAGNLVVKGNNNETLANLTFFAKAEVPLEQQPIAMQAADKLSVALKLAGVTKTPEQILQEGIQTQEIIGVDGKTYEIASTQDGYYIMVKTKEGNWEKINQINTDLITGQETGVLLEGYRLTDSVYLKALKEYKNVVISTDLQWQYIFSENGKHDFSYLKNTTLPNIKNGQFNLGVVNSLSWGNPDTLPKWLLEGNFTPEELKGILTDNVTLLSKFIGEYNPKYVNVVNEVDGNPWKGNFFTEKLGREEYVKLAFQTARLNLPEGTQLVLNDFGNNYSGEKKSEGLFNLVKSLNEQEIAVGGHNLIDAVGMQSPLAYLSNEELALLKPGSPQYDKLTNSFKEMVMRYKEIGVNIVVTENFVDQSKLAGSQENKNNQQAQIYYEFAKMCFDLDIPYYIYGPKDDNKAYPEGLGAQYKDANPYLVSEDGQDKLAYFAFLKAKMDSFLLASNQ